MMTVLAQIRRFGIAGLVVAAACSGSPSARAAAGTDPIDQALDRCLASDQGETTAGMVACTGIAIKAWDARLNETYRQSLAVLDPQSAALLRTAQRRWQAFREADQAALAGPWGNDRGTLVRVQIMQEELSTIRQRALALRLYLPND